MEAPSPVVLVVDDDPLVLSSTARYLRRMGVRPLCADSPFGVSAMIRKESPDVVVLDCHMPGLDGAHLVRILRSSPRTAHTPVVFHSGDSDEDLAKLARSLGVLYACKARGAFALYEAIREALTAQPPRKAAP